MSVNDIWVIARFEIVRHLRSRHAIVAGLLLIAFCGFGAYELAQFADKLAELDRDLGPALDMIAGMVESLTDLPVIGIRGLLREHPPVLVALFALVMLFMPLLCIILTYDQTATDIETRHVRYLLFRSDRVSIYLGKAAGALVLVSLAIALVLLIFGVFLGVRSSALEGLEGVVYLGRIWLTASLYAVPFVALLALSSALFGRARRALTATFLYWFAVGTLSGLLSLANDGFERLSYLFPSVGRFSLLLDDPAAVRGTVLYLLAFSLVAGLLGLWRFRSRDL
ncbi:ABC transporter permease [Enhygromyxa salina]|uniref:ABC transporter permease n=1 Tax=Enhygromyxa salina TaxID=215803 RepID=UPI0011B28517|nr:ABC transporter permease subunit [Enhygromyxa salina]